MVSLQDITILAKATVSQMSLCGQELKFAWVLCGHKTHWSGTPRVKHWSLTTLREKFIKIGAKVISHARYVIFQMAEVAVPRKLFCGILRRIHRLREPVPG